MSEATLSESLEDYLEAIYHIIKEKRAARPKDISQRLQVGNSSVTWALKNLAARNLVDYAPYGLVTLSDEGEALAKDVVERHEAIRRFFVEVLAVDEQLAETSACRMEHAIPKELLDRLVRFLDFVERCPYGGPGLIDGFRKHLESNCDLECHGVCQLAVSAGTEAARAPLPLAGGKRSSEATRRLADIRPGSRVTVVRVEAERRLRKRLLDLGLAAGTEIFVERVAPLGDPMVIVLHGTHLSLRREEAASVAVVPQG